MPDVAWDDDAKPEYLPKVLEEIAELESNGLAGAYDLIFHEVWLSGDPDGDCVLVFGKKNDDRYHLKFIPSSERRAPH